MYVHNSENANKVRMLTEVTSYVFGRGGGNCGSEAKYSALYLFRPRRS